jgi:aarF domain-containing kinase
MERLRGVSLIDLEGIKAYTPDPEGTLITALNVWSLSLVLCPIFHADVHAGRSQSEPPRNL